MRILLLWSSLSWLAACSGEAIEVSPIGGAAFEPDLVVGDEHIAVAWYDARTPPAQIHVRFYDKQLQPLTEERRLSSTTLPAYEASATFIGDKLAVAWYEVARNGEARVHLGSWDAQGQELWHKTLTDTGLRSRIPVLRTHDERLFIAWIEDSQPNPISLADPSRLHYAWFDDDGEVLYEGVMDAAASANTWNLNALVLDDTTMALSYHAQRDTQAIELHLALVSPNQHKVLRLSADDGNDSRYPDLALDGDTLALTWFDAVETQSDIRLKLFSRTLLDTESALALDRDALKVTNTPGESIGAYLSWSNGVLGLAWNDDSEGQHELYFQSFDRSGTPRSAIRRLTRTSTASLIPAIEAFEGDFLLSWSEVVLNGHDSPQATVMLQRVSP
jgi:hypothetical protein